MSGKVGIIGGGNMAEAIISGLLNKRVLTPDQIIVNEIIPERRNHLRKQYGVDVPHTIGKWVGEVDLIMVAVKPQQVPTVMKTLNHRIRDDQTLVSIAAGMPVDRMRGDLGRPQQPFIRVMPNTPALVGEGMSVMFPSKEVRPAVKERVTALLQGIGKVAEVEYESMMDAVTAVSGSGPAFIFMVIEALADAGVREGLSREMALLLANQTVLGSAKMVQETGRSPSLLREQVTSPGGTTAEGVAALEAQGLRHAIFEAVRATKNRSIELAKG